MYHIQNKDGRTVPTKIEGHSCIQNAESTGRYPDKYFYFAIDNTFTYAGSRPGFQLNVTYLDVPDGTLELQYDSMGAGIENIYKSGGNADFHGTRKWITHTFAFDDAWFGDRQNAGSDFRFFLGEDKTMYINRLTLIPVINKTNNK